METTQEILGMTDDEYGEHLKYDEGFSDGNHGHSINEYHATSDRYMSGFKTGRRYLREAYQRSLLHDFGPVLDRY